MAESQPRAAGPRRRAGALGPSGEKGPGPAESHPRLLGLPPRPRPADKGRNDGAGGGGGGRAGAGPGGAEEVRVCSPPSHASGELGGLGSGTSSE